MMIRSVSVTSQKCVKLKPDHLTLNMIKENLQVTLSLFCSMIKSCNNCNIFIIFFYIVII